MRKMYLLFLLSFYCLLSMAQGFAIKGKVVDKSSKEPLIGASILEVGTTNGVITDLDGNFQLKVLDESRLLEFSYMGYKSQRLKVKSVMNVTMELDSEVLDELVVVGYGTMRKSDLTGSVSKVTAENLGKVATVDVTQALQGKVAGVNIQLNSGEPGAGTKVRIRGVGTINSSDPLYVVDGFPVSDISHIAPNDIESIEVLKDASATAIYGSRGSNGVIMVKTKSGSYDQKVVVSVNTYGAMSQVVNQIDMLNAEEYALVKAESYANANMSLSNEWASMFKYVTDNHLKGTLWQDEIFRKAYTQNYNVNLSGGTEKAKFDVGMTYAKENGIVKNTHLDKFMAHVNNEYQLSKRIKLGINLFYTNHDKIGNNSDFYTGPLVGALRADPISSAWDKYRNDFGEMYFSYGTNPARSVDENRYHSQDENRFLVNSCLDIRDILVKGLSFHAQFGAKYVSSKNRDYYPVFYVTADQQRIQSSLSERRSETTEWSTSEYFSYNNLFKKHSINATIGFEASKFQNSFSDIKVYDVPEDFDLRYISASSNTTQFNASGLKTHSALASFFTRVNYNFDNRYLFTATLRADGSSKFKDRWGYFPSFSAGWNIDQESFMEKTRNVLSRLKLRAGWGQVGNQSAAGYNDYAALMTNGYNYVFGNKPIDGVIQQRIANNELSWETSQQTNIGVDFGFFKNKLSGTIDFFLRDTKDMILATPVPMYAGFWRPRTNAGSVRNTGVEIALDHSNQVNDFVYNLGFNITWIKNKITSIGGGDPIEGGNVTRIGNATRTEVGHEIAYFYGLKTDGIFHSQKEVDDYVNKDGNLIQPNAAPGDVKFVDVNNDGIIDEASDRVKLGSAIPDFTYGFTAGFAYKGFDLNLALQGSYGNELVNGMYSILQSSDMSEWNVGKVMLDRWTTDNPNSNIPRVHASDPNKNSKFSDRYVEDGSYLRIRNLQLGYNLPSALLSKIGVQRLRFYVSVDNLYTFTNYSGFDPEISGSDLDAGVDLATYPIPRTFSFGLNLQF